MIEYELLPLSYETYIEENNIEDTESNRNMWNAALEAAQYVSNHYMAPDQICHCENRMRTISA